MTDENLSDGEVRRNFERIDRRLDALANSTVPLDSWNRENGHTGQQIRDVEQACKERSKRMTNAIERLEKSRQITIGRLLAILAILATLLVGWWTALGTAKGIH